MENKTVYETPVIDVVAFATEDVLTGSASAGFDGDLDSF